MPALSPSGAVLLGHRALGYPEMRHPRGSVETLGVQQSLGLCTPALLCTIEGYDDVTIIAELCGHIFCGLSGLLMEISI